MKTKSNQFQHLKGKPAYILYWEQIYKCRPRLSTIQTIDLNLEIFVDEEYNLLAYRHDLPHDLMPLVVNAGHWRIYDEENQSDEVFNEVKKMIGRVKSGLCLN